MINNGKSNNGNPCPKTLDTKTQLQQQTVANAAETINKKCNYFYINSNTRPIREWMITQEHRSLCLPAVFSAKITLFCFFPGLEHLCQSGMNPLQHQTAESFPHRCSVLWCDRVPVPFDPALALQSIHDPVHLKRNELTQRYGSCGGENAVFCRWGTRFNPICMNIERGLE